MPNIIKHSYIAGAKISQRATAHLNYIQHRPGDDKERSGDDRKRAGDRDENGGREPGRTLNVMDEDQKAPGKAARDFKEAVSSWEQRGKYVHKFILSPSEKNVDMNAFTREMMDGIGQRKGQDLKYAWVVHGNTDHPHAHVVVLGKDQEGHQVRFNKTDHAFMHAIGDRYLEREHGVEMQFSKDVEFHARTHGHNLYLANHEQNLKWLDQPDRKSTWRQDEDFAHLMNLNRNWNEALEGPGREGGLSLGSVWMNDRGRLTEVHDLYQNTQNTDKWKDVAEHASDQEIKDYANKQLSDLQENRTATLQELQQKTGLTPDKFDSFIREMQDQFAVENMEIDMALYPEKYEIFYLDREDIDLKQVPKSDKIILDNGRVVTKYDTGEHLEDTRQALKKGYIERLEGEEFSKLCSWIGTKEKYGEDCFGLPPLKELQAEKTLDLKELSSQPAINLAELSEDLALDSKQIRDLLEPDLRANPELVEMTTLKDLDLLKLQERLDLHNPEHISKLDDLERTLEPSLELSHPEEPYFDPEIYRDELEPSLGDEIQHPEPGREQVEIEPAGADLEPEELNGEEINREDQQDLDVINYEIDPDDTLDEEDADMDFESEPDFDLERDDLDHDDDLQDYCDHELSTSTDGYDVDERKDEPERKEPDIESPSRESDDEHKHGKHPELGR